VVGGIGDSTYGREGQKERARKAVCSSSQDPVPKGKSPVAGIVFLFL